MTPAVLEAFFLEGLAGRLFCLRALPAKADRPQSTLIVPPFAEELNKSRHVLAAICRSLAASGHTVLLPDLFGTGDSEGDFGQATVEVWQSDLDRTAALLGSSRPLHVVALRAGALLLPGFVRRHPVASLTLIQPATDGRKYLTRFLRIGAAATVVGKEGRGSASELKRQLSHHQAVEVAGYRLSPRLAAGLEELDLTQLRTRSVGRIRWLELAPTADHSLLPNSQAMIDGWLSGGARLESKLLSCPQFWASQELVSCQGLIDDVTEGLRE